MRTCPEAIRGILKREGVTVRTAADVHQLRSTRAWRLAVASPAREGEPLVLGSDVLLAVGRAGSPTTSASTERASPTDPRGDITVDENLAHDVPGIWALGDCNGRGAFTHTAYNDFEIVAANLLDGEHGCVSAIGFPPTRPASIRPSVASV